MNRAAICARWDWTKGMQRLLGLVIITLFLTACGDSSSTDSQSPGAAPTITPVPTSPAAARPVYTVQRGTVQQTLVFTGRWLPRDQAQLGFEIAGTVRGVYVRRGDTVQAGDLLADFDTTELEAQLDSAELEYQTALNRLENSSEGSVQSVLDAQFALAGSRLSLENQEATSPWTSLENAQLGMERAQNALDDAQRAYDDAVSRPDTAPSTVDAAWQRVRDAEIGLHEAQNAYYAAAQSFNSHMIGVRQQENAVLRDELTLQEALTGTGADPDLVRGVMQAQLNLDQIQAKIDRASLRAPFDGIVLEITVQPGDSAAAFVPVITLALPEPKEAVASLAFNDTQQLSVGMVGICQQVNQPETRVQCAVRQIPLSSRDADQTTRIAASLDSLALGQLVEVAMPLQTRANVLWLPPAAIRTFQNRTFVVLETADGERVSDVELGLETDERVEIVRGVQAGDRVIGP